MKKSAFILCILVLCACNDIAPNVSMENDKSNVVACSARDSKAIIIDTLAAVEYYEKWYTKEDQEKYPYTYMMNKYMDIALNYMGVWSPDIAGEKIADKKRLFNQTSRRTLSSDREFIDLEYSNEDKFFSELYYRMAEELNTFSVIKKYISASHSILDEWDIILPFDGGFGYSKFDILYSEENSLPLGHEQYNTQEYTEKVEDCDCSSEKTLTEASQSPQRIVKYDLVSKWITDIRYRNYKSSCPNMSAMRKAMDEWEEAADYAIHFVEIKDNGWNRFSWGIGCNYYVCISDNVIGEVCGTSSVGAVPWAYIHINPECPEKGTYLHELGHTLTLMHEQCHIDRDCYIDIHFENVEPAYKMQFHKYRPSSATSYGTFDFESIMLYSSTAFSCNGKPTMTKKDGSLFKGQRKHLSKGDIQHIREIYN